MQAPIKINFQPMSEEYFFIILVFTLDCGSLNFLEIM